MIIDYDKTGSPNEMTKSLMESVQRALETNERRISELASISDGNGMGLLYLGEYITLQGNSNDPHTHALSSASTYVNTMRTGYYSVSKSGLAGDLYLSTDPESQNGYVTVRKPGRYKVTYQVYLYNSFTVNDLVTACVCVNYEDSLSPGASNARASRFRVTSVTNPATTLSGSCVVNLKKGDTLRLMCMCNNATSGTFACSAYTRMTVECIYTTDSDKIEPSVLRGATGPQGPRGLPGPQGPRGGGGGSGTDDYSDLTNKPQIEGVSLVGNKTFEDLNLVSITNTEIENALTLS